MKYISNNTGKEYSTVKELIESEGEQGKELSYSEVEDKKVYVPKKNEIHIHTHEEDFEYYNYISDLVENLCSEIQEKLKDKLNIDVNIKYTHGEDYDE